jgi:hypothetical protein
MRGNSRLAEDAFRAYTAIVAKGSSSAAQPRSSDTSRIGSTLYADHRLRTAEDAAPIDDSESPSLIATEDNHDPSVPRLPDEPLLNFASAAPHRRFGGSDEEEMSGTATLLALLQAFYLLIAMHKEMRLRQLNSHRIVPSKSRTCCSPALLKSSALLACSCP